MLPLFQSPTELLASKDGAGPVDLIGFPSLAGGTTQYSTTCSNIDVRAN